MFKFKKTTKFFDGKSPFEDEVQKVKKTMFRLIFALAMSLRVTPKKLAKFFDADKVDEYARKFHDELLIVDQKEKEKIVKSLGSKVKNKNTK